MRFLLLFTAINYAEEPTFNALVHKNPNGMAGSPLTYTVQVDGNTLRMVIADPPFLQGRGWRTVLTRVE